MSSGVTETERGPGEARGVRRRTYGRVYAVLMYATAVVYFAQAILAGQFLSGSYPALSWHQYGATTTDVLLVFALIAAGLLRWQSQGKGWPFLVALAFFIANQVQNFAGAERLVSLHIPLGVLMIAGAIVVVIYAGRAGAPPERRAAA